MWVNQLIDWTQCLSIPDLNYRLCAQRDELIQSSVVNQLKQGEHGIAGTVGMVK